MAKSHNKTILILAVIVVAVAVAVYKNQERTNSVTFEPRGMLEGVAIEKIVRIEIANDATSVTLKRISSREWGVHSRHDYPVDNEQLTRSVMSVLNIEAIDQLTKNREKHERLGVGETPEQVLVRFLDKNGAELGVLYVGKDRESSSAPAPAMPGAPNFSVPQGQFFRVAGDPAVYVSKETLNLDATPTRWLRREIVRLEQNDLQEIRIQNPTTTESLTLRSGAADSFEIVSAIPQGYKAKSYGASSVSRAVANLTLKDVLPADDPRAQSMEPGPTYRAIQKDGLVYKVSTGVIADDYYVKVSADYDSSLDLSPQDEPTTMTQVADAMKPAITTSKDFNERHGKWLYQIEKYSYDNLTKKLSDLIEKVEPIEEEKTEEPAATPNSGANAAQTVPIQPASAPASRPATDPDADD